MSLAMKNVCGTFLNYPHEMNNPQHRIIPGLTSLLALFFFVSTGSEISPSCGSDPVG